MRYLYCMKQYQLVADSQLPMREREIFCIGVFQYVCVDGSFIVTFKLFFFLIALTFMDMVDALFILM